MKILQMWTRGMPYLDQIFAGLEEAENAFWILYILIFLGFKSATDFDERRALRVDCDKVFTI